MKLIYLFLCILILFTGCTQKEAPPSKTETSTPMPSPTTAPSAAPKVIGSYTTKILDKDPERVSNIKLALKSLNGKSIAPGESFSFNTTVGPRTAERGYKKALAIINEHKEEVEGGGICQLSSTLFNAVDKAGLKVTEKHKHSKKVNYVAEGRDAAVSYGQLDFKFVNTLDKPVTIEGSVGQNQVTMSLIQKP